MPMGWLLEIASRVRSLTACSFNKVEPKPQGYFEAFLSFPYSLPPIAVFVRGGFGLLSVHSGSGEYKRL
jgi:hypothetical protein